jgi:hypothetical protein
MPNKILDPPAMYRTNGSGSDNPRSALPRGENSALDDLIGGKARILNVKLAVFASEIIERLRLRVLNQERIDSDEEQVRQLIDTTDRQARYHFREHHDKRVLYETLFELREERRSQDVECWRDIVDVMRDFLTVWESLEQAKARSIFLDHARR